MGVDKRNQLTSLEIRNLILETLSYEGEDINEGNNFKKYGYMGHQSDLFRLMELLAIRKKIIPDTTKVPRGAWGCDGYILHESFTTNFSRNEILKIYQEFALLQTQGIIAPGAYGNYGVNLPYFHVTDHGLKCLKEKAILPYDQDEYLKQLEEISNINEWVIFYIRQSLQCFNTNCFEASIIMIGLASEVIVEELIDNFTKYLNTKNKSLKDDFIKKLSKARTISRKYDIYLKYLKKCSTKHENIDNNLKNLSKKLDCSARHIYTTFTRLTRNELSHPNGVIMERIEVLMFFITFVKYCKLQYQFINYYKNSK